MDDLIEIRAINTRAASFSARLQAKGDTCHALEILAMIVEDSVADAPMRARGTAAITTLRAALKQ